MVFCFGGCSAAANLSVVRQSNAFRILRKIDSSGKISLDYVFPLNSDVLFKNGATAKQVENYKFYLTSFVNTLTQSNKQKECDGVEVCGVAYYYDVDGVGFSINFDDIKAQKKFFGTEGGQENGGINVTMRGFFVKKQTLKTTFPISSAKAAGDLKLVCVMAISSWCADNDISAELKNAALDALKSSTYIYDFASSQKALKSQFVYHDQNGQHNFFVKTFQEVEENPEIEFFVVQPNRPVWYLSALIIVLTGILFAFLFAKKKKVKKT